MGVFIKNFSRVSIPLVLLVWGSAESLAARSAGKYSGGGGFDNFSLGMAGAMARNTLDAETRVSFFGLTSTEQKSYFGNSFGGGIMPQLHLTDQAGFETGVLYLPRSFSVENTQLTQNVLQVSPMLRFWFLPRLLSLGFGGYHAWSLGKYIVYNSQDRSSSRYSYGTDSLQNTDYGLAGAMSLELPLLDNVSFLAEGRYCYGLKKVVDLKILDDEAQGLAAASFSAKYRAMNWLAGARIIF